MSHPSRPGRPGRASHAGYSVGQVAALAKVTVRTLHHYDEIGLLVPSGRSHAGHRRYSDHDLDRLQQIRFYRELGFPLDEVAALLDDPDADPQEHLRRQHRLLTDRITKLQDMAAAVKTAMEARRMGINLTPEEKFEVFGDFEPDHYEEEVQRRWGDTDAYAESRRRTAAYTKEDWQRLTDTMASIHARMGDLLAAGLSPESPEAMDVAEEHRRFISSGYYACSYEMHRGLGEMYVADARFTATYEAIRTGLAAYLRAAITANAARHGA
ncbi:MerR family transcriptional regulator [Streptomyces sp. NPDC059063]|uniref:MerR family transcriptional regulator n=1 Tax=unclassified Streptomyces TaxID=2593676 RepID=UPI0036B364A0